MSINEFSPDEVLSAHCTDEQVIQNQKFRQSSSVHDQSVPYTTDRCSHPLELNAQDGG